MTLLSIEKLSLKSVKTDENLLKKVSLSVSKNEIVGVIGESGSGKSLTAMSILRLLKETAIRKTNGSIIFDGRSIFELSNQSLRNLRGKDIGMIFQEPMSSLNPSKKCGVQVAEVLYQHNMYDKKEGIKKVLSLFEKVKLPNPKTIFNKYPHQLSGGQKQRVMIAMAIACKPKLLIADEPTTALDVTVQKEIIDLLKEIQKETQMSVLFISHDLALVKSLANRIAVMKSGVLVEVNATSIILNQAEHPYTKALLKAYPPIDKRLKKLPTIESAETFIPQEHLITKEERKAYLKNIYTSNPILEIKSLSKSYTTSKGWRKSHTFKALKNISFDVYKGETVGLVGDSGCGKSTLGNILVQLLNPSNGEIRYQGKSIYHLKSSEIKNIQLIFQDPYASLNPVQSIGKTIMEPMRAHNLYRSDTNRKKKTIELLERIGLQSSHFDRKPYEFSGGQRQRIGIARAIGLMPKIIICDEIVSALDISSQAQVLNLLNDLKRDFNFTYLFISHDLAIVKHISDKLIVIEKGVIVEQGETDNVYNNPQSAYTKKLIQAIPKIKL